MLSNPLQEQLMTISEYSLVNETKAVKTLLEYLQPLERMESAISKRATRLATALRSDGAGNGVEAFLHEYGLDTEEGIAVMCLAEALLRIPDSETADQLIKDKFEDTDWEKHLGKSDSLFVNASSWGLLITGKVVNFSADGARNIIKKLIGRTGEPVIRESLRAAMRFMGHTFVMGETIDKALKNSKKDAKQGYRFSFDMLGEGARTAAQAEGYYKAYSNSITKIGEASANKDIFAADSISIKLSALHPRYTMAQKKRVMAELLPRLVALMTQAKKAGIMVAIDAEEATRLDLSLELFAALLDTPELKGWNGCGFVVQAYQKRAFTVVDYLAALAKKHDVTIPLRLVKGAYWDSEIKWAQLAGVEGYPVFTHKEHTDVSYLATAKKILEAGNYFYPQFATHNARTIASIMEMAGKSPYEFQRLHGMGEKLHDMIVKEVPSRVYAPVGEHKDLLAYLIRRLLENGANTSFVNLLMDEEVTMDELLADPVAITRAREANPNSRIPLPQNIYGNRKNSAGVDFGIKAHLIELQEGVAKFAGSEWNGGPLGDFTLAKDLKSRPMPQPALLEKSVGTITEGDAQTVVDAMQAARKAFHSWANTPVERRAAILEKAADLLEAHRDELMALLSREAGKTLPDGVAEVREAADFCRYYAQQAKKLMHCETLVGPTGESNILQFHPRGVFGCISPWNFPLAIFTGQVMAAVATGNCVLAKPAAQTPLVAHRAVELFYEAGVPRGVLQLIPGGGSTVGQAIVEHPELAGVVFTGSVATAQRINRTLAERKGAIVPLIAETGGQNCMVVDSSALLETALDDIILSAFGSAGQRCSALRVLLVQDEIAGHMIELIRGALAELKPGNPIDISTDVGPVIDEGAHKMLAAHIERMKKEATFIAAASMPEEFNKGGHFIAPHAFEIPSLDILTEEVFGPVLHVLRYKAADFTKLPDVVNGTGFGLTFGVHSRIEDHAEYLSRHVQAGNIYINRSMIGATVGVQPFGGEGLSGTGPKAGGPLYLTRFITERTVTDNTAAMGGNVSLLS
ncbi:MAG: bifunctional proline dehydrogenase/L-glutamate gamma-semialdehyde dehydrogenase PutA [Alphaproteobacteria bacterium]